MTNTPLLGSDRSCMTSLRVMPRQSALTIIGVCWRCLASRLAAVVVAAACAACASGCTEPVWEDIAARSTPKKAPQPAGTATPTAGRAGREQPILM